MAIVKSEICEFFNYTGSTFTDVPDLEVSITTSGEPVQLQLQPASATPDAAPGGSIGAYRTYGFFGFSRDGVRFPLVTLNAWQSSPSGNVDIPCSALAYIDTPPAGVHTYRVFMRISTAGNAETPTVNITQAQLVAVSLPG